jgi:hypothetical protein
VLIAAQRFSNRPSFLAVAADLFSAALAADVPRVLLEGLAENAGAPGRPGGFAAVPRRRVCSGRPKEQQCRSRFSRGRLSR